MATFKQYDKKDGTKAWQFRAYLGIDKSTGKDIETTRRGFKTKKEAQLALNRLQVDYEKNGGLNKSSNETFQEVYELWFETYETTVKEVTKIKNEIKFKKWILPKYGKLRIKEITVKQAQKIVNDWAKVTDQYRVLHSTTSRVFRYAMNLGIIENNPLERVLMPKRETTQKKEPIKIYSKEELSKLFAYFKSLEPGYRNEYDHTLLHLLIYSGCRISEALALNWTDIDFENNQININKTLSQSKHGYKVSSPKTDMSNAKLALDEITMKRLKKWQLNQRKYMFTLGITDPTMVFCGIYKEIVTHHSIYSRLKTITANADIPFLGIHVTRHTHASLLLESGASMKDVQDRLRHASIKMTMDIYSHLSQESKEKTVENFVKHLNIN